MKKLLRQIFTSNTQEGALIRAAVFANTLAVVGVVAAVNLTSANQEQENEFSVAQSGEDLIIANASDKSEICPNWNIEP